MSENGSLCAKIRQLEIVKLVKTFILTSFCNFKNKTWIGV